MSTNMPSITLQHYVLKKNGYNQHFFQRFQCYREETHFCNAINILYCTLIKPVLKYGPYHVDSFEKSVDTII